MEWDRSKQNYWVLRRGDPWKVINNKTNKVVADYPKKYYDDGVLQSVCFAETDKQVIEALKQVEKNKSNELPLVTCFLPCEE